MDVEGKITRHMLASCLEIKKRKHGRLEMGARGGYFNGGLSVEIIQKI